jgi:murein DD-endopeptidase MepM/ murein hydrolase activator NlpD
LRSTLQTTLRARLHRAFPEKRLFLKSDGETRFLRIGTGTQILALGGAALFVGWTIVASSILLMNALGAGNLREQSARQQEIYETRLNAMAAARDDRAEEARLAHERFARALDEVSQMQARLLASENGRRELEQGIEVIQATLRRTIAERDAARDEAGLLLAKLDEATAPIADDLARLREIEATVDLLADALGDTAGERDEVATAAAEAAQQIEELELEAKLVEERNDRIFRQLEDAVAVSMEPLDEMFRAANLPADSILETVRRGYSGEGGPLTPLTFSTKGAPPDADTLRANSILERLDALNLYRIAVEKTPFAEPVRGAFRYTSSFGPRRDPKTGGSRMHEGSDFAASHGTPIYSTADGVVIHAGWQGGYGRLVKIRHEFGIETRYAHLSNIRVREGQRVSRGDRIGDMGNSGRSTGTHLHYEVRIGGRPVNPMTYIKAARDVF